MTIDVGDIVELKTDLPSEGLRRGDQAQVIEIINQWNEVYELRFDVYAEAAPIQLMLTGDEVERPASFTAAEATGVSLKHPDADNLIDVLRYVQTDPTVHPSQRYWCWETGNQIEAIVRCPTVHDVNATLAGARLFPRDIKIRRVGPRHWSRWRILNPAAPF